MSLAGTTVPWQWPHIAREDALGGEHSRFQVIAAKFVGTRTLFLFSALFLSRIWSEDELQMKTLKIVFAQNNRIWPILLL